MSVCSFETVKINPHSSKINEIISKIHASKRPQWKVKFQNNSHEEVHDMLTHGFFSNLVHSSFPRAYVKSHSCADCGKKSEQRCHGIGESRPELLKRALKVVWPDTKKPVTLREISEEFFRQHKKTGFDFKCTSCHKKEPRNAKTKFTPTKKSPSLRRSTSF